MADDGKGWGTLLSFWKERDDGGDWEERARNLKFKFDCEIEQENQLAKYMEEDFKRNAQAEQLAMHRTFDAYEIAERL